MVYCKLVYMIYEWNLNRFYILIFIVWKLRFKVINVCIYVLKVYLLLIIFYSLIFLLVFFVVNKDFEGFYCIVFILLLWVFYYVIIKWIYVDIYVYVYVIFGF